MSSAQAYFGSGEVDSGLDAGKTYLASGKAHLGSCKSHFGSGMASIGSSEITY